MSLDLQPPPDQDLSLAQTPSDVLIGDPVADLSRQSGLPSEALAALSPEERTGMAALEGNVAQLLSNAGRPGSNVTRETVQAAVVARNQVRDDVAARYETESLDGVQLADARVQIDRRVPGAEQGATTPMDARLQIRDQTITIESDVYLYGSGATQEIADTFERQIQQEWGQNPATGRPWTYTDPDSGQTYNVRFDVDVQLYDPDNPGSTPRIVPEQYFPWNRDNFIEVTTDDRISRVFGGDEGQWRAHGRNGRALASDNPAAHEFGHLLGLPDRYIKGDGPDKGQPLPGWEGNIMAMPAGRGHVEQRDIDTLVQSHVDRYERAGSPGTFNSEINPRRGDFIPR